MASICISNCISNVRAPVRTTFVNLYKWPESDAEFVKSISSNKITKGLAAACHPRVADSISCQQLYLRSYTFSRKESVPQKTKKWLGRVRDRVNVYKKTRNGSSGCRVQRRRNFRSAIRKAKGVSCAAISSIFWRLLSCTTKIDVVG